MPLGQLESAPNAYRTMLHGGRGWVLKEDADRVRAERDRLRGVLWACYQATGADTSSDDPSRSDWAVYAVEAVKELRGQEERLGEAVDYLLASLQNIDIVGQESHVEEYDEAIRAIEEAIRV